MSTDLDILRDVRIENPLRGGKPFRLTTWDTGRQIHGKDRLGYRFGYEGDAPIFEGEDFGASPCDSIDSDNTLYALLSFLTLRPGDTDSEYFEAYTVAQLAWAKSSECESLACDVSCAEEDAREAKRNGEEAISLFQDIE